MCSLDNFRAVVDESNNLIIQDNNILVCNIADNSTLYIPNNLESRVALNVEPEFNEGESVICNTVEDTTEDSQRWTHESILLLLSLYEDNVVAFKSPKTTNKKIWNEISKQMILQGYSFTGDQCDLKLRNLKKTYKRIKDNNIIRQRCNIMAIHECI